MVSGKKARGNVDDDPFIGAALLHDGPVKLTGIYQHNIKGTKLIPSPFNGIGRVPAQKKQHLVKVMIMRCNFQRIVVLQMKYPEIVIQISLLLIVFHQTAHFFHCFSSRSAAAGGRFSCFSLRPL